MVEIKRILFPTDLTKNSSKVLPYVLSVSDKYNSMIYLLHVIENAPTLRASEVAAAYDEKEALNEAEAEIDNVCEKQLESCPGFQKKVVFGNPAMEILKAIKTVGIDLVVMGTRGRKGTSRIFFGSVAESVIKSSPVPVLVVSSQTVK
jgi:nucleotide-binding universal stress UspA family protein